METPRPVARDGASDRARSPHHSGRDQCSGAGDADVAGSQPAGANRLGEVREFRRNGLTFEYRIWGPDSGEPIVLLHGFPQDMRTWEPIARRLGTTNRVLVPIQRGYHRTSTPRLWSSYRLSRLRADIAFLLDVEHCPDAHMVGHDWGGSVAWSLAREQPGRVRSLTVISMPEARALLRAMAGRQLIRSWYVPILQTPFVPESLVRWFSGRLAAHWLAATGLPEPVARRYVVAMSGGGRRPAGPFNWYRAMIFNLPEVVSNRRIQPATLQIWSEEDDAVDLSGILRSARWVSGDYRLEIVKGASHWLPEQHPELIAEFVREHVMANARTYR